VLYNRNKGSCRIEVTTRHQHAQLNAAGTGKQLDLQVFTQVNLISLGKGLQLLQQEVGLQVIVQFPAHINCIGQCAEKEIRVFRNKKAVLLHHFNVLVQVIPALLKAIDRIVI